MGFGLATPYRGRAIPCGLITYASKTIAARGQGFSELLCIMTNLAAQKRLRIYLTLMIIDESCRDLNSLLGMPRLMNQQQEIIEMLAMLLLTYAIGLLVGEGLRAHLYDEEIGKKGKKWKHYSGLFILLKQKWSLPAKEWQAIVTTALASFLVMVRYPVRTHV